MRVYRVALTQASTPLLHLRWCGIIMLLLHSSSHRSASERQEAIDRLHASLHYIQLQTSLANDRQAEEHEDARHSFHQFQNAPACTAACPSRRGIRLPPDNEAHYDKVPVHLKRPHGEIVFADSPQDQARRSLSKQV